MGVVGWVLGTGESRCIVGFVSSDDLDIPFGRGCGDKTNNITFQFSFKLRNRRIWYHFVVDLFV